MQNKLKKKRIILISGVVIAILIIGVAGWFISCKKQDKSENLGNNELTQYDNKVSEVQEKIEIQQKVIDNLEEELTPLVEQRSELEQQMSELTETNQ